MTLKWSPRKLSVDNDQAFESSAKACGLGENLVGTISSSDHGIIMAIQDHKGLIPINSSYERGTMGQSDYTNVSS